MKKLPIGVQNLREIRQGGYCYVDKSRFVQRLADAGKCYFLSRPRRFGKSLFLDTLKEAFEGNRELFRGLALEPHWDWSQTFPVIRLDLGMGVIQSRAELEKKIWNWLHDLYDGRLDPDRLTLSDAFFKVIQAAHAKGGPVVVLVDEYDKPILDNLGHPERARELREGLKNLYSVLKSADPLLKMVFLTGVSKFSKVSLFSGLNNLEDLTLAPKYATLCGYTERDLDEVFGEHLATFDRAEVRRWYNGYRFLGESVYNPFDVLLLIRNGEFRNFWFETGTPTFLVDLMREKRFFAPRLDRLVSTSDLLSSFDVPIIEPETLLFQAGYLTIAEAKSLGAQQQLTLTWPNFEVKSSLAASLLTSYTANHEAMANAQTKLLQVLHDGQLDALGPLFHAFFASIPHDWYRKNQLAGYEGYYASIVYCYFVALGLEVIAEDVTNHGRIDLTVKHAGRVYLFEFKVKGLAGKGNAGRARPMTWLLKKNYHEKYRTAAPEVYLVGVEFDPETRNIKSFEWRRAFAPREA